jgi:hypothetical protein
MGLFSPEKEKKDKVKNILNICQKRSHAPDMGVPCAFFCAFSAPYKIWTVFIFHKK